MLLWFFSFYVACFIIAVDCRPVCDKAYSYVEVAEDTPVGTVVKEISCTRSSASSGDLSYGITDGNTNGKFGMNSTGGIGYVFVYQSISFESRTTSFQLSIEVSESTPYRASTNFVLDIQVTGVNDYAPLFLFSPYTVYINENVGPGTVISKPIPYDFDKGNDGSTTSSIIEGDDSLFYMDPKTAKVYLRKDLDYERQADYVITIEVTDNGIPVRRSSTSVINVHVKDINDNTPVCDDTYLTETFEETKEEGAVIKFIKCSDADAGNNGRLSYTIAEGDYTKFRLQGPYLILSKQVDVDREPKVWTLSVRVRDRGNPRLSTMVDVVLYVEGVDDNSPKWAPPNNGRYVIGSLPRIFADLEESTPVGTRVVQIAADDLDKTDSHDAAVIYYMDDYTHVFTIKPKTGDIFLNNELDREKVSDYRLPVSAVSIDNPMDRITTDVIINVIDVNDFTPEFEKDVFQYFIREDVAVQTEIANITAKDLDIDENGEVLYMITNGNTDSVFDVDTQTGLISVVGRLDYESQTSYSILVRAMDRGRPARWSTCTVIISILPVNEFEPLVRDMNTVNILEDTSIGQSIFEIEASDGDAGLDGTMVYSIVSDSGPFTVEHFTGTVRLLYQLDRETISSYSVQIEVRDMSESEPKSMVFNVNINILDVNDNIPECDMFYVETLFPPIQSGDVILKVNCTDNDEGQNSKLSYSILSGNINSDMAISYDGGLTVLRNPSTAEYRLEIEVRDGGTPSLSTFVIAVITTGSKPAFNNIPVSIDVSEDTKIGKSIFQVKSDSVSKQIKYEITKIINRETLVELQSVVKIDSFTGIVYIWKELDRETTETVAMTVKASDSISRMEAESSLTITVVDVNDNPPVFDKTIYNISVVENVPPMSSLLKVSVNDLDSGSNGRFDLFIADDDYGIFNIDEDGFIITRSDIDREKADRYTLVLKATDRGDEIRYTGTATVLILVIDADEYSPEIIDVDSDLETILSEDTPLGSKIFTIEARDFDIKSDLTYFIQNSNDDCFLIDIKSGSIYLSKLLDREEQDMYKLVILVADEGGKTATGTITVTVADVNDNEPQFESHILKYEVSESFKKDDIVGSINVVDKDLKQNGQISLSLTEGNIDGAFEVKGFDLLVAGTVDYDKMTQYLLILEATDNGLPRRTSTATVIVEVEPDMKPPQFPVDFQEVNILENLYIGYVIFDFDATQLGAREDIASEIVYSLASGNENGMFGLDKKTGQLTVARSIDRELNGDYYEMIIMATNLYNTGLRDEILVGVTVEDVNDNHPVFTNDRYSFEIKESTNVGSVLGTVTAEDSDSGRNADISYEITGGAESEDTFAIDKYTGEISLKRKINYFYDQVFHFSVIAYDNGSPSLSSKSMLTVNVIDINNNVPVFDQDRFTVSIRESIKPGKQVYQVHAHDDDSGINGEILFRIVSGNNDGCFELDSENGELRTSKLLNRENIDKFELIIEAEDKGSPSLTGSSTITIIISDVNDNKPEFDRAVFTVSLNRFAPVETSVITITATDADVGRNAHIDYQLIGQNEGYFQIDTRTGAINTFADLSMFENSIDVIVVAKDKGNPRLSSSTIIDVQLHPTKFKEVEDYSFAVSEYEPPNTFIGTLGTQSGMKYAIEKGNFKNNFRISEDDGNIFLQGILDREEYSDYFLVVHYYHRMTPDLENKLNVYVKVLDENDNNPKFLRDEYKFLVLEHTPVGFSIAELSARDMDYGDNGNISYFIMDEEAELYFTVDATGSIFVKKSVSYQTANKMSFTVVAADNGQFSRSGSCKVEIDIVDIDESTFDNGSGRKSNFLSVQIPTSASTGYLVLTLKPSHFSLYVKDSKVRYLTHDNKNIFKVDEISGDVILRRPESVTPGFSYWLWVVAKLVNFDGGKESMALIRIESFQPGRQVVVFTHAVSLHILEINRAMFEEQLKKIIPSSYPVVWKLEGENVFSRRKLLQTTSKSFVYFLRNNETTVDINYKEEERFVHQNKLMQMLKESDGRVSDKLNTESFDNFPVIAVDRYEEAAAEGEQWVKSEAGLITIVVCSAGLLLLLVILIAVLVKKKCRCIWFSKLKTGVVNGIAPHPKPIQPLYNNIKSSKSATDTLPVMETLRILGKMSEEERNEILQKAFNTKQTDEILALKWNINSGRTTSAVLYNVQDETTGKAPRKVSNEEVVTKTKMNEYKHAGLKGTHASGNTAAHANRDVESGNKQTGNKDGKNTSSGEINPTRRRSTLTSVSVSSLELDPEPAIGDTASESEVIVRETNTEPCSKKTQPEKNNRTLVIGGKEYDGVGKDKKTNGKYLYNTRTGDKLHVTDDILKRAIEQRQSVVQPEFNEVIHGGRMSTFKRPLKRKMSRSRFSTTTIWEMSVDVENGNKNDDTDHVFVDNDVPGSELQTITGRQRRFGVDHSAKLNQPPPKMVFEDNMAETGVYIADQQVDIDKQNGKSIEEKREESSASEESDLTENSEYDHDDELGTDFAETMESGEPAEVDTVDRKIHANFKWDKLLANTVPKPNNGPTADNGTNNKWTRAQKIVKYVRPVYKPLNLDNVTCKVPKGKSDPKDCLSKDPVYVGWAKLVGRRMKKKVVKTKDGPSKTVMSREGRSLPAALFATQKSQPTEKVKPKDVITYTKIVSSLTPPHLNRKRMSISNS